MALQLKRLYTRDDYHPSPVGTVLQAYIIFWTITAEAPPAYDTHWRKLHFRLCCWFNIPIDEEAVELYEEIARRVCGPKEAGWQAGRPEN